MSELPTIPTEDEKDGLLDTKETFAGNMQEKRERPQSAYGMRTIEKQRSDPICIVNNATRRSAGRLLTTSRSRSRNNRSKDPVSEGKKSARRGSVKPRSRSRQSIEMI